MNLYADLSYMGEDCFSIHIFNDINNDTVDFWSDGDEIQHDPDQRSTYDADFDEYCYMHIDFKRLITMCKRELEQSQRGYIDELDINACVKE